MGDSAPPARPAAPGDRARTAALALLAGWAAVLSIESWFRSPGVDQPPPLPDQLLHQGRLHRRTAPRPDRQRLPEQLVTLAAADYVSPGRPRLAVRWLTLPSSGRGVVFPLEQVAPAVLGPGARGSCQIAAAPGTAAPQLRTSRQLRAALEATAPRGGQWWLWVAGLRPFQRNACLWTGWLG